MNFEPNTNAAAKMLGVLKDIPFWLLAGLAISTDILLYLSTTIDVLPKEAGSWIIIAAVFANILAIARLVDLALIGLINWRSEKAKRRTFHVSVDDRQAHWSTAHQKDDSIITQITISLTVKNLTTDVLGLTNPKLIRPKIKGEIVHNDILISNSSSGVHGTYLHSGYRIPANSIAHASLHLMIRGVPKIDETENLKAVLSLSDDQGNEGKFKVSLKGRYRPQKKKPEPPAEKAYLISNPLEKEIVSVLQSEIARYEKNGRERGAFGSLYMTYNGKDVLGFGQDSWTPNSPTNQSIISNPDDSELCSDNLNALLSLYKKLETAEEKDIFKSALLDRIDERKGYLSVSYFIFCVLLEIGFLKNAIQKAKKLPENEIQVFGLSNILLLINGLLRYRHIEFSSEILDEIESFVHGLKKEHIFGILEKISAIRSARIAQ